MTSLLIASSAGSDFHLWRDLGEVVLFGMGAGVGLAIAFGLAMRGLILGSTAHREGNGVSAVGHYAIGVVFAVVCVAAVAFALASMLHR